MAEIKITSWNINSVRMRTDQIARFVDRIQPDILCLQELKCQNDEFPVKTFNAMGFEHLAICGQKGLNGVCIASRYSLKEIASPDLCREGHARHIAVEVAGFELHNIYLPAGGDEPDPETNPKFAHKLDFVTRMHKVYQDRAKGNGSPMILVGDLNIAPREHDVWSHKQLLNVVSHTPVETTRFEAMRKAADFVDLAREKWPENQKVYSWWSYRSRDWAASNRGRRLDHIWIERKALACAKIDSFEIDLAARGGFKPSDHAPVSAIFTPA